MSRKKKKNKILEKDKVQQSDSDSYEDFRKPSLVPNVKENLLATASAIANGTSTGTSGSTGTGGGTVKSIGSSNRDKSASSTLSKGFVR